MAILPLILTFITEVNLRIILLLFIILNSLTNYLTLLDPLFSFVMKKVLCFKCDKTSLFLKKIAFVSILQIS